MSEREHDLTNTECWCEPRIKLVVANDGETNRVIVHHTEACAMTIGKGCICDDPRHAP